MALAIATQKQADRFRNDLAATEDSFPDSEVDELYEMAGEIYPGEAQAIELRVRITAIRRLLASAAKMVTYTQNASEEVLSDISKNLREMLEDYQRELEGETGGATVYSAVRIGSMKKIPTTVAEVPNA